jgi:hypothetical protein
MFSCLLGFINWGSLLAAPDALLLFCLCHWWNQLINGPSILSQCSQIVLKTKKKIKKWLQPPTQICD